MLRSINSLGLILQLRMQQNMVNLCHHLHFVIRILSSAIHHPLLTLQRPENFWNVYSFATMKPQKITVEPQH